MWRPCRRCPSGQRSALEFRRSTAGGHDAEGTLGIHLRLAKTRRGELVPAAAGGIARTDPARGAAARGGDHRRGRRGVDSCRRVAVVGIQAGDGLRHLGGRAAPRGAAARRRGRSGCVAMRRHSRRRSAAGRRSTSGTIARCFTSSRPQPIVTGMLHRSRAPSDRTATSSWPRSPRMVRRAAADSTWSGIRPLIFTRNSGRTSS